MTFIELVQELHMACRVQGDAPTSVLDQPKPIQRLIRFIKRAWMDIQNERESWSWMRRSISFPTVYGKPLYSLTDIEVANTGFAATFGNWDRYTFRVYTTSAGKNSEIFLDYVPYDWWRDSYQFSGFRDARTMPIDFTWAPDFAIGLGPTPTADYTIEGDYFQCATELVADADVPGLPPQFHWAIVYRAMMFYGGASEAAIEVYSEGKAEFEKLMTKVRDRELIEITVGPALV